MEMDLEKRAIAGDERALEWSCWRDMKIRSIVRLMRI